MDIILHPEPIGLPLESNTCKSSIALLLSSGLQLLFYYLIYWLERECDDQIMNLGDQIIEFNGNSLVDSTYEEVRSMHCGDYVQLLVHHNTIRLN